MPEDGKGFQFCTVIVILFNTLRKLRCFEQPQQKGAVCQQIPGVTNILYGDERVETIGLNLRQQKRKTRLCHFSKYFRAKK